MLFLFFLYTHVSYTCMQSIISVSHKDALMSFVYHIDTHAHMVPVKQKLRCMRTKWLLKIKEEFTKQLIEGFEEDFRNLNKAFPKDDFPLPHIDVLVDNTAGNTLMSFMDGFLGYNQIKIAPRDMTKTTFATKWGIYCYTVMPFRLKNLGVTYQRMATALLHDMMHNKVEVYINDTIVKSK